MDLGIHLVDLLLWVTGAAGATVESSRLLRAGQKMTTAGRCDDVEDMALALLTTDRGATVRLACSWRLPVGGDCAFGCTFYGTDGAVSIQNVDGSFYDFATLHLRGTEAQTLVAPPDDWGPRAISAWATKLAVGGRFDPEADRLITLARVLDDIYAAAA
jgi:predicted dehydrogenase